MRRKNEETIKKIIELAKEGVHDRIISVEVNMAVASVRNYRLKAGLKRKSGGKALGTRRRMCRSRGSADGVKLSVTTEARELGWTLRDSVTVIVNSENDRLIVQRVIK